MGILQLHFLLVETFRTGPFLPKIVTEQDHFTDNFTRNAGRAYTSINNKGSHTAVCALKILSLCRFSLRGLYYKANACEKKIQI